MPGEVWLRIRETGRRCTVKLRRAPGASCKHRPASHDAASDLFHMVVLRGVTAQRASAGAELRS